MENATQPTAGTPELESDRAWDEFTERLTELVPNRDDQIELSDLATAVVMYSEQEALTSAEITGPNGATFRLVADVVPDLPVVQVSTREDLIANGIPSEHADGVLARGSGRLHLPHAILEVVV